jgi:serine/threonine-protein kinase RsbW
VKNAPPKPRGRRRPALVFAFPSDTGYLSLVRDLTRRMAAEAGFADATAEQLSLAVDEATTNVLKHAYHGATDREVEIRFDDAGGALRVDIVDNGDTVDPRAIPRVDLEKYVAERRKGGLGMHLMEKIMDSVTYRRSARRNVCTMVKRKDAPEAD